MVIGFDGSRSFTSYRTGTENYSYQLLKALRKIDQKNKYVIYLRPHSVILNGPAVSDDYNKWPKNFKFKEISWPRFWTQAGLALQTFKDKLDILFVPAHTVPLIRRPGLKTIITVHDLGSEYLPQTHQLKQRLYLSFMQRYQLNSATKIIAVSKATKDDLVKRVGIEPDKITVIYEGFDKKTFKPIKGNILINSLRQFELKIGEYFLFVGTVQPRKNLARLIEAFSRFCHPEREKSPVDSSSAKDLKIESIRPLPNRQSRDSSAEFTLERSKGPQNDSIKLLIAGSKGWLSDEIYSLPKQLGIEDKVKFLGYVSIKVLPHLYSGAKALLFPSLFEGFGLPILESQACGCPVLTSNISSMPEISGKGAIFVDPYNIDDIVKGMRKIEDRRLRMGKILLGFENIKRFSWEKCARETLDVFESA